MKTYWNYEETPARRVRVRVPKAERSLYWYARLTGTIRRAVVVVCGESSYVLDDEDGSGWTKVTRGRGGSEWGHKQYPDDIEIVEELDN